MTDAIQLKEKIVSILKIKGPSIPVRIAKEINMSPLFTSAFLSELLSEKTIKTSHMKMGGTPIYLIPGQEIQLEPFAEQYLKSKEKEAFLLLKEKKFLMDLEQEPAIRVALRVIRDFAVPFKRDNEIYWRYLTISEDEFEKEPIKKKDEKIKEEEKKEKITTPKIRVGKTQEDLGGHLYKETSKQKPPDIFEKESKLKKKSKKKTTSKKDGRFFNKVKEFLSQKGIEILDIQDFNKKEITLIVKENEKEKLLIAYNKKKVDENDIIKASQKASKLNLFYIIISKGELPKKTLNFIEAIKNLNKIEKLE